MRTWTEYESPIGRLTLRGDGGVLTAIHFPGRIGRLGDATRDPGAFAEPVRQLDEYFAGERSEFRLDVVLDGTDFERAVWRELLKIPYGETRSYGALARAVGQPDEARAVGTAVGRTPVPIVVPCHRVVGSDGSLTGYGGGLDRKRSLLDLEAGQLALL
ncbi:MAG TPA: methylated-DNA--[protein]-cysteine S-methyltransferase [Thermoleophilaceae bacterium]|jgi:methylated-DNA-[protein]-cysteine S-methyltransferase